MARRQAGGFWSNLLGYQAPREKFSLEELRHLHEVLKENSVVTDSNRDSVVEALRAIAELMIWGDQHDPRFFDFFLEQNLMRHFSQFLEKGSNRRGEVAKQVLQTLYILIQNIRSQTAIYYIFSNNHVNDIVTLRFDFEDDEVLGYYINLLKTISLRLTSKTVQFFFQDDGEHTAFPLYTEAIKFIDHRDGMVRAAVRTLTLNVYSIDDPAIREFVASRPASNYFNELAIVIAEQCQMLDRQLSTLEAGTSGAAYTVETSLANIEDLLSYSNDILATGDEKLASLLLQCLWTSFAQPILFAPLGGLIGTNECLPTDSATVGPLCSLCVLERLLSVMNDPVFTTLLGSAMILPSQEEPLAMSKAADDKEEPESFKDFAENPRGLYREGILGALRSGEAPLAAAAVRVILALIQSPAIDSSVLFRAGLAPHESRKRKQLLEMLTAEGGPSEDSVPGSANLFSRSSMDTRKNRSSQASSSGRGGDGSLDNGTSSHGSAIHPPVSHGRSRSMPTADGSASDAPGLSGEESWWVDALCEVLMLEMLPSLALWAAAHLLLKLVPRSKSGATLSPRQRDLLAQALAGAQKAVAEQAGGMWSDALSLLVALDWPKSRAGLLSAPSKSTAVAVQAWMQAIQAQKLAVDSSKPPGSASARAAAQTLHASQRLVSLTQLHQGLFKGEISSELPFPASVEAAMKRNEVREGAMVELRWPAKCTVAFSKGAERSVLFAVHALPEAAVPQDNEGGSPSRSSALSSAEAAGIASSVPCVVLAKPIDDRPGTGVVLSVAPLIGAEVLVDPKHARWLHVHVRPHVRGLLKTVRGSDAGTALHLIERQLVDGHWVLSFPDADSAAATRDHVEQQAACMKGLLRDVLEPLLASPR